MNDRNGNKARAIKAAFLADRKTPVETLAQVAGSSIPYASTVRAKLLAGTFKDPPAAGPMKRPMIVRALQANPEMTNKELAAKLGCSFVYVRDIREELWPTPKKSKLRPLVMKELAASPLASPLEIAQRSGASVAYVRNLVGELTRYGEMEKMIRKASGTEAALMPPGGAQGRPANTTAVMLKGGSPIVEKMLIRATDTAAWYEHALEVIADIFTCPRRGGKCGNCPACLAKKALAGAPDPYNWLELRAIELRRKTVDYEKRFKELLVERFADLLDAPEFLPALAGVRMERAAEEKIASVKTVLALKESAADGNGGDQ